EVERIVSGSFTLAQFNGRFVVLTLLGAMAVLCLPRQFHMLVVEATEDRLSGSMRWLFPVYLALICAAVLPVIVAGRVLLPPDSPADMLMIDLPLAFEAHWLAILAFIGGFSASTGMIIVTSIALSGMITNDLIVPVFFRDQFRRRGEPELVGQALINIRRGTVVGLLALAYLYFRAIGSEATLAGLGEIAFAGAAQFAPGLFLGFTWRKANRVGMIAGLIGGFGLWLLLLGMPVFGPDMVPLVVGSDPLVSGTVLSLTFNVLLFVVFSLAVEPNLQDRVQAMAFIERGIPDLGQSRLVTQTRVADFRLLLEQFVGQEHSREALNRLRLKTGRRYADTDPVDDELLDTSERMISSIIGSSSARALIQSTLEGDPVSLEQVVAMFDETSQRLQFGAGLLQIAIENIDQGISVVDGEQRLVAWNHRYVEMFGYPPELIEVGRPVADLLRFNMRALGVPEEAIEHEVVKRLDHLRAGRRHSTERTLSDGRILRVLGKAAPNGGYVTTYTDVTADRLAEQALEAKVKERTQQLVEANRALEAATQSKTRFLAAASHDLVQPMNAARLFASALREELEGEETPEHRRSEHALLGQIDRSIETADRLLRALLDISRLDGGKLQAQAVRFPLDQAFAEVANEFEVQAANKGLQLVVQPCGLWLETDRGLFISVLQNLVTNAVRYSDSGKILVGAKRRGREVEVLVADRGRGIPAAERERIFDEFTRLGDARDEEGLGLGLAIVRRIAALLGTEVAVWSEEGRGSCFSFRLPVAEAGREAQAPERSRAGAAEARKTQVLCIDDDRDGLEAIGALLSRWGFDVVTARDPRDVDLADPPGLMILDYRLEDGLTGDKAGAMLCERWGGCPPTILLTAEDTEETKAAAERIAAKRMIKPPAPAALRALVNALAG
ncbi:MAG: PAS-domain containing protein, partial [Novosphingobium sp.]|nr:PAS-domain containing protein [Novosphingobium sp.]